MSGENKQEGLPKAVVGRVEVSRCNTSQAKDIPVKELLALRKAYAEMGMVLTGVLFVTPHGAGLMMPEEAEQGLLRAPQLRKDVCHALRDTADRLEAAAAAELTEIPPDVDGARSVEEVIRRAGMEN